VTTVPVISTVGAPATGYVTFSGEAIHYSSKTLTSFTGCTRHDDGTQAAAHKQGDVGKVGLVAAHHNSVVQAIIALETKVGTGNTGIDGAQIKDGSIGGVKLTDATIPFKKVSNVTFTRALLNVNQPNLQGVPLINLQPVVGEDDGNWNVGLHRWVAPGPGTVLVTFRLACLNGGADCVGGYFKNGLLNARGSEATSGGPYQNSSVGAVTDIVAMNDYIDLRVSFISVNGIGVAGSAQTYMSIIFFPSS
jgi:hypothetical protein